MCRHISGNNSLCVAHPRQDTESTITASPLQVEPYWFFKTCPLQYAFNMGNNNGIKSEKGDIYIIVFIKYNLCLSENENSKAINSRIWVFLKVKILQQKKISLFYRELSVIKRASNSDRAIYEWNSQASEYILVRRVRYSLPNLESW